MFLLPPMQHHSFFTNLTSLFIYLDRQGGCYSSEVSIKVGYRQSTVANKTLHSRLLSPRVGSLDWIRLTGGRQNTDPQSMEYLNGPILLAATPTTKIR